MASGPTPVGIGVSQYHYSENIGPYTESPSIHQGQKENLEDALAHSLSATSRDSTGQCSIALNSHWLHKKKARGETFATERFYLK